MQVTKEGSVRVDLVGGTLDLEPINLILSNVVTLNVATSLKAKVSIESMNTDEIIIDSKDYSEEFKVSLNDFTEHNLYIEPKFDHFNFVLQIVDQFELGNKGLRIS